jgi:hypothetical protein
MLSFSQNRQGLKELANFNIDAQFVQQIGSQVFNYQGEETQQYKDMCKDLSNIVDDTIADLTEVKKLIPLF